MFRNKHFIAALIITPILAVLGYFAVDALVSEKPHAAKQGGSYQLVARSNCRYASGQCSLVNGEFEIYLRAERAQSGALMLILDSVFPLQGARLAIVKDGEEGAAINLRAEDETSQRWTIGISETLGSESGFRLAAMADDALYYGESELTFIDYSTSFGEDFRSDSQ